MAKNKDEIEYLPRDGTSEYISLKEAADISQYSPDYIGQLIREGKIEGKQVYSNISWVTTEQAVQEYMERKGKRPTRTNDDDEVERLSGLMCGLLYGVIGLSVIALVVFVYIFAVGIDRTLTDSYTDDFNIETPSL
jgi:hypothetical protein